MNSIKEIGYYCLRLPTALLGILLLFVPFAPDIEGDEDLASTFLVRLLTLAVGILGDLSIAHTSVNSTKLVCFFRTKSHLCL